MKKSILNIGKILNKLEQKTISGGDFPELKPTCCDPAVSCCTTTYAALNAACGTYIPGCNYHPSSWCCI